MLKKQGWFGVLFIFLLPQSLYSKDVQGICDSVCNTSPDRDCNFLCVPEGYQGSFTLKFKEAPDKAALSEGVEKLRLPGVSFSKVFLNARGHYTLYFQAKGSLGREIRCFSKDHLKGWMTYIQKHLPKLTAIELNRQVPYVHCFSRKEKLSTSSAF